MTKLINPPPPPVPRPDDDIPVTYGDLRKIRDFASDGYKKYEKKGKEKKDGDPYFSWASRREAYAAIYLTCRDIVGKD